MNKKQEVEKYLKELKQKIDIFGILIWDDRGKNRQTLFELEITPRLREEFIMKLTYFDYVEGPLEEKIYGMLPMWVFGITIKGAEVYIKVIMSRENSEAVCISFHVAEYQLNYPLKTK
mgnify:CR=1 FL=1